MVRKRLISMALVLAMMLVFVPGMTVHAEVNTVSVSTADELRAAIASDTKIILNSGTYSFEHELGIQGVENLSIVGTEGTKIVSTSYADTVIIISASKNVSVSNVFIGHDVPAEGGCVSGVLYIYHSENITFENCDVYGCGTEGFYAGNSKVSFTNCVIRDCSHNIGSVNDSEIVFDSCVIRDNGYGNGNLGRSEYGSETRGLVISGYDSEYTTLLTFNDCVFQNNNNTFFKSEYSTDGERARLNTEEDYNTGFTRVNNCTFTDNTWQQSGGSAASEPAYPTATEYTALPTSSSVIVNGTPTSFDAYNINDNNYFKLRDLAFVLTGTEKGFGVSWDGDNNAISLTSNSEYIPVGGEMATGNSEVKTATATSSTVVVDGWEVSFTAYNIDGNNYFKLRDIGETFDFGVIWDGDRNTIVIDTSIGYTP